MLKDIVISTKTIMVDEKQSFEVGGLTLTNIGTLAKENFEPLNKLMEGNLDIQNIDKEYPEFLAKVVAAACGEPDEWKKIHTFPFPVQLVAFEACWDLTVPDYESLKKLVERIKGIIPELQGNKDSK